MGYKCINHKGHVMKLYNYNGRENKSIGSKYKDYFDKQKSHQDSFENGNTSAGKEMFENQYQHAIHTELSTLPQTIFVQGLAILAALATSKGIIDQGLGNETIKAILATGFLESIVVWGEVYNFKLFNNAKKQLATINKIHKEETISKSKETDLKEMLSNSDSNDIENTNTLKK